MLSKSFRIPKMAIDGYGWNPESRLRIFNLMEKPYLNLIVYGESGGNGSSYPRPVIYSHYKEDSSK